jgi:putative hemolysin
MDVRRSLVATVLVAAAALYACDDEGGDEPELPNPASAFCEEQGGRVELEIDDTGGERGICVLPDGTRVDEWQYFRDHHEDQG